MRQNEWFGRKAATFLAELCCDPSWRPVVFSYSYTAAPVFKMAKRWRLSTVLGQIDCGPSEQRIVQRLAQQHPEQAPGCAPPPPAYWEDWRRELKLADKIIVNSEWSRHNLLQEGIAAARISVIPLAYEPPEAVQSFKRSYPNGFTKARPLRVLFLGQLNMRKGMMVVLDAIRALSGEPIEFVFVGPELIAIPDEYRQMSQVKWCGSVPRAEVSTFYRQADVFLFPTLSDGFGLTQLEAQAWKLPIIASQFCGEVVRDGLNGIVLPVVSAGAVGEALRSCCYHPSRLSAFAQNAVPMSEYTLGKLADRLGRLWDAGLMRTS